MVEDCYVEDKTGLLFNLPTIYLTKEEMLQRIEEEILSYASKNNFIFKKLSRQRWQLITPDNIYRFYLVFRGVETIQYETEPPMYTRANYYILTRKIY